MLHYYMKFISPAGRRAMKPLAGLVEALPVPALRPDASALFTASRFLPRFLAAGPWSAAQLNDPFASTVERHPHLRP